MRRLARILSALLALMCAPVAPCVAEGAPEYVYDLELRARSVGGGEAAAPEPGSAERSPEEILRSLSLEQRVRQMLLVSCHDAGNALRAARFGAGGVCLYANFFAGKDAQAVRAALAELREAADLPPLLSVDEEGGSVCRVSANPELRSERFSAPRRLYESGGWAAVEAAEREKARLLRALGLNLNLAPVCDVPTGSGDYIYARSFGTDPARTAEFAARAVRIALEEGIGCALKHFPGYGGSNDTHSGLAYDDRPYDAFREADFLPFESGIAAGAPAVMVSHNIVRCMDAENPASLSPEAHRILRRELGFEGVIVTDDLHMGAIRQFTGEADAAVRAVLAGNDLLCCADYEASAAAIVAAVEDGTIPRAQIDASALRVLRWKRALGLV